MDAPRANITAAEDALVLDVLVPSAFQARRDADVKGVDVDISLLTEAHMLAMERHRDYQQQQQAAHTGEQAPASVFDARRHDNAQYAAEVERVRRVQKSVNQHIEGQLPPHPFKFHRQYEHHRHLSQCDVAVASLFAASYTPPHGRQAVAQYGLSSSAFAPNMDPRSELQTGFQVTLVQQSAEAAKYKLRVRDSKHFRYQVGHYGAPSRSNAPNVGMHGEEPSILRVALPRGGNVEAEVAAAGDRAVEPLNLQAMQHCSHWNVTALALRRAEVCLREALRGNAAAVLDEPFVQNPYEGVQDVIEMHHQTKEQKRLAVTNALRSKAYRRHADGTAFKTHLPPRVTSRLLWLLYNAAIVYQADVLMVNGRLPESDAEVWACLLQSTGTVAILPPVAAAEALVMLGASDLAQPLSVAPGVNSGLDTPQRFHAHGFPAHMTQHTPHAHQQTAAAAEAAPRVPYGFPGQYRPVDRCARRAATHAAERSSAGDDAWEAERRRLLEQGTTDRHGVFVQFEDDPDLHADRTVYANARAMAARTVASHSTSSVAAEVAKWMGYGDDAHNARVVLQAHLPLMMKDANEASAVLDRQLYTRMMNGMFRDTAPVNALGDDREGDDTSVLGHPLDNAVHTWRRVSSGEFLRSAGVPGVIAQWQDGAAAGGGVCQSSGLVARIRMHLLGIVASFAPAPRENMSEEYEKFVLGRATQIAPHILVGIPPALGAETRHPLPTGEVNHLLLDGSCLTACMQPQVQVQEYAQRGWMAFALRCRVPRVVPVWDKSYQWVHDAAARANAPAPAVGDVQIMQQYANAHAIVPLTAMVPLVPALCSSEDAAAGHFAAAALHSSLPGERLSIGAAVEVGFPHGPACGIVDQYVLRQFMPVEEDVQFTDVALLSEGTRLPISPGFERTELRRVPQELAAYVGGANASVWGMLANLRSQAVREGNITAENAVLGTLLLMFAYRAHTNAHSSTLGPVPTVETWLESTKHIAEWMEPLTGRGLMQIVKNVHQAAQRAANAADPSAHRMAAAAALQAQRAVEGAGPRVPPQQNAATGSGPSGHPQSSSGPATPAMPPSAAGTPSPRRAKRWREEDASPAGPTVPTGDGSDRNKLQNTQ